MKPKEDLQFGEVLELLQGAQYRVRIGEKIVRCMTTGKMRLNKIRVLPGDRVSVFVSGDIGRIERRL